MNDAPLFDWAEGQRRKREGQDQAADNKASLLQFVRDGLENIARGRHDRTVTADDAARYLVANGISDKALGSAAGSLFRGRQWEFTGQWAKSARVTNHGSDLRIWRLK